MRKLVSIALLFCMLLSTSSCSNTQESNADTPVSEVVGSNDTVENGAAASNSGEQEMSLTDAVQDEDSETEEQSDDIETAEENAEEELLNMKVQIGDSVFTATLEENEAVNVFVEMMEEAPVVIEMSDYSGFVSHFFFDRLCPIRITANARKPRFRFAPSRSFLAFQ